MTINPGRRLTIFYFVVLLCFGLILWRFFDLSIIKHSYYKAQAAKQYQTAKKVPGERGKIYAGSDQFPLATNLEKYQVMAVPKNIKDKKITAEKLAALLDLNEKEIFSAINNQKLYIPPLKRGLELDQAQKIIKEDLAGILVIPESQRFYPEGPLAAHLLGFVNKEGKGQYGLEGYWDDELRGIEGELVYEKDTQGRFISLPKKKPSRAGSGLILTIDRNIQYMIEQKLSEGVEKFAAEGGTIIVQNPKTGAILGMASSPNFDSNNYSQFAPEEQSVFLNPVTSLQWEPGSVFKPIAMAAAIDKGVVEPETEGTFSNFTVVQGYEIHTAQDKAFGKETMTQVLENSDNVAMVWVTEKLGKEDFSKYIKDFGFGLKTGIDLEAEEAGNVMPLRQWREINRATMSFGQGIAMTPIQLVSAFSALANKGVLMRPYVVSKVIRENNDILLTQPKEVRRVIKEETAAKITGMLVSVVEKGHGKKAGVENYKVAGKTGTAQIPKKEGGYEESAHIGSFAGFFPAEDPKITMLVKFNRPQNVEFAESSAAPIFGELAAWMVNYLGIPANK
ncbi:penicillin-binding protein 2 [Candidatus Berkelbacteria bacterium]|nr:penicillin-binding protein 2 [Candidatus Berkelbacteria bacterium]